MRRTGCALAVLLLVGCQAGGEAEGSRLLALARSLFETTGGAEAGPGRAPPRAPSSPAAAVPAPEAQAPPASRLPEAPTSGTRVYYQFVDPSGTVRFVDTLEAVPAEQRASAGRIEIDASAATAARANRPVRQAFRYTPPPPPQVVVYTAPWCGWCRRTLDYLDEKRVRYDNRDIDANPAHRRELIEKTGRTAIPVVEINGQRVNGYDPGRIDRLLAAAS